MHRLFQINKIFFVFSNQLKFFQIQLNFCRFSNQLKFSNQSTSSVLLNRARNAVERVSHIGEVGNATANQQHLMRK